MRQIRKVYGTCIVLDMGVHIFSAPLEFRQVKSTAAMAPTYMAVDQG